MSLPVKPLMGEIAYDAPSGDCYQWTGGGGWVLISPHIRFPHCDQNALCSPGKCEYCDAAFQLQGNRLRLNVNFTGETTDLHPCPSDFKRGLAGAHVWPGNRPKKYDKDYNSTCPRCGGKAYVGFDSVDCSNQCGDK